MTLIVAVACQDFAILASDTRGIWRDSRTGARVDHTDEVQKIHPLRGHAWFASGPACDWGDHLQDLGARTDGTLDAVLAAIREAPADDHVARVASQSCFWIGATKDGRLSAVNWKVMRDGSVCEVATALPAQIIGFALSAEDMPHFPQYVAVCQRELQALREAPGPGDALRALARFLQAAHDDPDSDGRIGRYMEAGVLLRRANGRIETRWLDRTPHTTVAIDGAALLGGATAMAGGVR
jgi:hypothetical protein